MKKTFSIIVCALLCIGAVFALSATTTGTHSGWLDVDFAYYPGHTNYVPSGEKFAALDTKNWGIEGRITPWYQFQVATPMGKHWLVKDANTKYRFGLEITPVSIMPKFKVSFTPVPFLVFSAGANIGTGWDLGKAFQGGMAIWDGGLKTPEKRKDAKGREYYQTSLTYTPLAPFEHMYFEPWFEGLFQFDVAALMPKEKQDWMHIVMMASYKIKYTGITGVKDTEIWEWQLSGNQVNGWSNYASVLFGYQMPKIVINTVGLLFEYEQYFKSNTLESSHLWNYVGVPIYSLSPCAVLKFNDHHSLTFQARFKTMRTFATTNKSITGIVNGSAWYFDRIALSYCWSI